MNIILTPAAIACGVTEAQVIDVRSRGLIFDNVFAFMAPRDTPPAVASAAARLALGSERIEFSHLFRGCPVYRLEEPDPAPVYAPALASTLNQHWSDGVHDAEV